MSKNAQTTAGEGQGGLFEALQRANDLRMVLALGRLAYRAAQLASQSEPQISTRKRLLQTGVPAVIAALASQIRPTIRLRPHAVEVKADREALVADLRQRLSSNSDVLVADEKTLLGRFAGRAGVLPYRTLELVRFSPDSVDLEHLGGSFYAASERFSLENGADGRTRMEHTGEFKMRGGLIGWPFGQLAVRPLFERHVARNMAKTAERFEDAA